METTEILEILGMVNDLENISKVEITLSDPPSIIIEKTSGTNAKEASYPKFTPALSHSPETPSNLATEGQRKYADDLANKLGEGDMMNIVYGLAEALGEVAEDILHPSLWKTQMTRDHADAYIDILEEQYKKMKKGGFQ